MVRYFAFIYIFIFICILPIYLTRKLDVLYQWKSVDFTYLTNEARNNDLNNGNFVPDNCIIIDVDVWQPEAEIGGRVIVHPEYPDSHSNKIKRRVFVTLPRFKSGIPVTFAEVSDKKRASTSLLSPFPNWEAHRPGNCDGLTSVYRTMIDTCGRLWVLDSGVINNFGPDSVRQCPPKVVAYDLKNKDRIVERYEFPRQVLQDDSLLISISVDTRGNNCRDTFVYVADVVSYKLIVYDVNNGVSWRVNSDLFYPYPLEGRFNIAGTRFHLMDGLFGLALSPLKSKTRTLYFHSLASFSEGWIDTSIIRNRSLLQNNEDAAFYMFSSSRSVRPSQSAAEAMTENGVLIFSLLSEIALACYNIQTPYTKENLHIVEQDSNTLQFPSGMKVIKNQLWVITSEFQNYIAETAKADDVKYRILTGSIDQLLYSSGCDYREEDYEEIPEDIWTSRDEYDVIMNWNPIKLNNNINNNKNKNNPIQSNIPTISHKVASKTMSTDAVSDVPKKWLTQHLPSKLQNYYKNLHNAKHDAWSYDCRYQHFPQQPTTYHIYCSFIADHKPNKLITQFL